jgi:hypothetical protein
MAEEININGWAADVARILKQADAAKADADVVSSTELPVVVVLESAGTVAPEVAVPVVPDEPVVEVTAPEVPAVPVVPTVPTVPVVPVVETTEETPPEV